MKIMHSDMRPIFVQIASSIEDDILNGVLNEGEQVYSQNQIANDLNINPATAAKGLNLLADEGILYRKRGFGMFVAENSRETIQSKRSENFFSGLLRELVLEARKLNIDMDKVKQMIDQIAREGEE